VLSCTGLPFQPSNRFVRTECPKKRIRYKEKEEFKINYTVRRKNKTHKYGKEGIKYGCSAVCFIPICCR
jgi:hypothetical protein